MFSLNRSITIRQGLLRILVLLVTLVAMATLSVTYIENSRTVKQLTTTLIDHTSLQSAERLSNLFMPVENAVRVAHSWGRRGLLRAAGPSEVERLNTLFIPMLETHPQILSLMISTDEGYEYFLLREETDQGLRWFNRIMWIDHWGEQAHWLRWSDAGEMIEKGEQQLKYDPRPRPWYQKSLESLDGKGAWTDVYMFFTSKIPGVTVGSSWRDEAEDNRQYVVAFDVSLSDISEYTTAQEISPRGLVLVTDEQLRTIGLPRDPRFVTDQGINSAVLKTVGDLDIPVIDAIIESLGHKVVETFSFEQGDETWWAELRPFPLGEGALWISILVPEGDFLGNFEVQQSIIWAISLLSLLAAIVIAIYVSRAFGRPLESLVRQSQRISEFDLSDGEPVSSRLTEVGHLALAQQQMLSALRSFSRYVPVPVVRQLWRRGEVARIGGENREVTIMFSDIRGFTSIAEHLEPQALTDQMAEYFTELLAGLETQGATIDKFIGDAVMAFWGAPNEDDQHARHAVEAIINCKTRLNTLNQCWEDQGLPVLKTGFGLNTGTVVVGNLGARERLSYTVLGDAVNTASRLEGLNKEYGVDNVISQTTREAAGPGYVWCHLDRAVVKGKSQSVEIYTLLGREGEVDEITLQQARRHESALGAFHLKDYDKARHILESGIGFGRASQRLHELCRQIGDEPVD